MSLRLLLKSVTLNGLDRRQGPYLAFFIEIGSFWGALRRSGWRHSVYRNFRRQKCSPKHL